MAISSITLRVDGNVAYDDNTNGTFEYTFDSRFGNVLKDPDSVYNDVLDYQDSLPTHVISYTYHVSGQVASDDNTITSFDFYQDETGSLSGTAFAAPDSIAAILAATAQFPAVFADAGVALRA